MIFVAPNNFTESLELSAAVLERARQLAERIERENAAHRRENKQGINPAHSLTFRISGYQGEAAVALYLGLAPKTDDHWQQRRDVGGFDVMTSKRPDAGLIFTPRNPLWSVKILVIDECPIFHIVGCYQCADARERAEWWREPRPGGGCWIVPQRELRRVNSGDDVRPIGEYEARALDRFSHEWRGELANAGVRPPQPSPLAKAVVDRALVDPAITETMAAEPYGSANRVTYNPGGLVVKADVPAELGTHRPPKEP